jgi:hypothetical protein
MTISFARLASVLTVGLAVLAANPAAAAPAGMIRDAAVQAAPSDQVETVNHRWRRGGASITLQFGGGYYGPRYYGPRYAPRYYAPRAYYPRYAPRHHRGLANAHFRWCSAKYRSFRAWDNTFQPYRGGRKQCVSPYF